MKIKPFSVVFPDKKLLESPDELAANAKFTFQKNLNKGLYQHHPRNAFYIYQIEFGGRKHIGLVALNDVEDFFDGKVRQHEHTLNEKEKQQMNLILQWKAVLKPVLLTYRDVPEITEWLQEYTRHHHAIFSARFDSGTQLHKVWQVPNNNDIEVLQALFRKHLQRVYIADGHHRTTTMAILHEERNKHPELDLDHLFCAFFSDLQLEILDYNRAVEALEKYSPLQFMAKLSKVFDIEVLVSEGKPRQQHELSLYLCKQWFRLRWKSELLASYSAEPFIFDASLLNDLVLRDILDISDVRSDSRINYIDGSKGLRGVEKVCKSGNKKVGFVLYPVNFDGLVQVADSGGSLPPKSTYFAPRLKSGILVQSLKK
ncbi:MAG: DUF1015 domain-containing protein [Lewinellaceae bacterium]|nr:DUF1015 domain-containing protein [Lewinellaceae bacterium]